MLVISLTRKALLYKEKAYFDFLHFTRDFCDKTLDDTMKDSIEYEEEINNIYNIILLLVSNSPIPDNFQVEYFEYSATTIFVPEILFSSKIDNGFNDLVV